MVCGHFVIVRLALIYRYVRQTIALSLRGEC